MTRPLVVHAPTLTAAIGAAACAAALLLALADPARALRGWLAAAFLWSALPIGALCLLMMMRLIPGRWSEELTPASETAVLLLPIAALALLPVLCGIHPLYAWASESLDGAFRSLYLSPWFFVTRTVVFFAVAIVLAGLLHLRSTWSTPVSCIGLVFFAVAGTSVSVDWLMSLEPEFHSSGFGLYALAIQVDTALALLVLATLAARPHLDRPGVLGGLLLAGLLLWAYFAFMPYFIIWSGNLPPGVRWYLNRSGPVWGTLFAVVATLRLGTAALLLFKPVRQGRRWLAALCALQVVASAIEAAWLVLPAGGEEAGAVGIAAWLLSAGGLGCLSGAAMIVAGRARIRARIRTPAREAAT